jgi:hypothetical protein
LADHSIRGHRYSIESLAYVQVVRVVGELLRDLDRMLTPCVRHPVPDSATARDHEQAGLAVGQLPLLMKPLEHDLRV